MNHTGWQLKIADMLQTNVTDEIVIENQDLDMIVGLSEEWISAKIRLQSLWKDAIFAVIEELECEITESCDSCGREYQRAVNVQDYSAKYVLSVDEDEPEEEVLLIDQRNGIIDLWELVYHAIKMQEPFVKRCPDCENKEISDDDQDLEERE